MTSCDVIPFRRLLSTPLNCVPPASTSTQPHNLAPRSSFTVYLLEGYKYLQLILLLCLLFLLFFNYLPLSSPSSTTVSDLQISRITSRRRKTRKYRPYHHHLHSTCGLRTIYLSWVAGIIVSNPLETFAPSQHINFKPRRSLIITTLLVIVSKVLTSLYSKQQNLTRVRDNCLAGECFLEFITSKPRRCNHYHAYPQIVICGNWKSQVPDIDIAKQHHIIFNPARFISCLYGEHEADIAFNRASNTRKCQLVVSGLKSRSSMSAPFFCNLARGPYFFFFFRQHEFPTLTSPG